jgi:hypothetical protein
MASLVLEISYAQLAVFDASLTQPFNDWSDAHVRQGFSWRAGSVSFRTLESAGPIAVQVFHSRQLDLGTSRAERIITVPFTVPASGEIEVASISSGAPLLLPAGEYELTLEHGSSKESGMWANLYFERSLQPVAARILRADAALEPPHTFVMTAGPA